MGGDILGQIQGAIRDGEVDVFDAMRALIEAERDRLFAEARKLQAEVLRIRTDARTKLPVLQQGRYGFKAERAGSGPVRLRWIVLRFYGPKGDRKVTFRHQTKGKGDRYPLHVFDRVQAWEAAMIEDIENRAAPIRRRLNALSELALKINGARRVKADDGHGEETEERDAG